MVERMDKNTDAPQELEFESLSQVFDEVQRLSATGYRALGKWNLAQICGHLNCWMTYPLDGYPVPKLHVRMVLWMVRFTVGKRLLHKIITEKKMKSGGPTLPVTVFPPNALDEHEAIQAFGRAIQRFDSFNDIIRPSPVFGSMDYETARKLQLIHCAHHLRLLIPKD